MPFDATCSVFHPRLPHLPVSSIDVRPQGEAPRLSFTALQHIRTRRLFFSLSPFEESVFPALPCVGRSAVHRVWLPSRRGQAPRTLGGLFHPPTLLGFPLQSFSPPPRSDGRFRPPFPFLRLEPKPPGFGAALQRLGPTEGAVLLLAPNGLSWDGGTALLRFSDLSGPPSEKTHRKSISLFRCPSRPYAMRASRLTQR